MEMIFTFADLCDGALERAPVLDDTDSAEISRAVQSGGLQ